jgi:hypothetical protein
MSCGLRRLRSCVRRSRGAERWGGGERGGAQELPDHPSHASVRSTIEDRRGDPGGRWCPVSVRLLSPFPCAGRFPWRPSPAFLSK